MVEELRGLIEAEVQPVVAGLGFRLVELTAQIENGLYFECWHNLLTPKLFRT